MKRQLLGLNKLLLLEMCSATTASNFTIVIVYNSAKAVSNNTQTYQEKKVG